MLEFHIVFVFDNKSEEEHHKLSVSVFYHKGLNLVLATGLFLHRVLEPAIAPARVTFAGKLRRAGRGRSVVGVGPAGGGGARPSRGDITGLDDPSRRTRAEADDGGWKVRSGGQEGSGAALRVQHSGIWPAHAPTGSWARAPAIAGLGGLEGPRGPCPPCAGLRAQGRRDPAPFPPPAARRTGDSFVYDQRAGGSGRAFQNTPNSAGPALHSPGSICFEI